MRLNTNTRAARTAQPPTIEGDNVKFINRKTIALGAASLAVMVGAGSALALGTASDNEAMLGDVAASLGVEQEALEEALRDAQINRVDAALADGELSEERAEQLRERIESAETPRLAAPGGHHGKGFGHHGKGFGGPRAALEPAAEALGLTAEEQNVPAADVEAAIVAAGQERLDEALESGRIDAERAAELTERITERAGDMVEREVPEEGFERGGKRGFGPRGERGADGAGGLLPAPAPAEQSADNGEVTPL